MPRRPSAARTAGTADAPAAAEAWLRLDHQLCFALYSASLAMTRRYKPLLEPMGLTYPQYLVMLALWEADDQTVSALGQRLALDSGTLTPLLKRLEALGHVERRRDAADERRVRIGLTDAGRALRQGAVAVPQAIAAASGCSLGELSELTARVQALRDRLFAANDEPRPADAAAAARPSRSPSAR